MIEKVFNCKMIKYFLISFFYVYSAFADDSKNSVASTVDEFVKPLMIQQQIPGLALGLIIKGKTYVFNYGILSKESKSPVTDETLFEIGSISKTFSATLATLAQEKKIINLNDTVDKYLLNLKNSEVGKIPLANLATHVSGGFPLQVPENIKNNSQLMSYFKNWNPTYSIDSHRTYANPSIGLLGLVLAKSMNSKFSKLVDKEILKKLKMNDTFFEIPSQNFIHYAQGYSRDNTPARLSPGILAEESYGMKTSIKDMIKFVEANLNTQPIDNNLQKAINKTHETYYKVGAMTQLLVWEQYNYPMKLEDLLFGNSAEVSMKANKVVKISPPIQSKENVIINKTGSTNGFGAYIAFIPYLKSGIVILANKNYPNEERVKFSYEILTRLLK